MKFCTCFFLNVSLWLLRISYLQILINLQCFSTTLFSYACSSPWWHASTLGRANQSCKTSKRKPRTSWGKEFTSPHGEDGDHWTCTIETMPEIFSMRRIKKRTTTIITGVPFAWKILNLDRRLWSLHAVMFSMENVSCHGWRAAVDAQFAGLRFLSKWEIVECKSNDL